MGYIMKKIFALVLILIFLISPIGRPRAAEMVAISQIRPLVEWVETRTNVMLLPRPKIYISSEALLRLTADRNEESEHVRIAAYRNGTIFISDLFWEPGDVADDSVLIHELVHYAQDVGGQTYACANQREEEAYRLQNAYLIEHGERPFLDKEEMNQLKVCN
jgi:hypothetical protein